MVNKKFGFLFLLIILSSCAGHEQREYSIVYSMKGEERTGIYFFDTVEDKHTLITPHLSYASEPDLSQNGQWMVFQSKSKEDDLTTSEIVLLDRYSSEYIFITQNDYYDGSPSISDDGKFISYISEVDGNFDLFLHEIGGETTQITNDSYLDMSPYWLENDLYFISTRDNVYLFSRFDLYRYNLKLKQVELVTKVVSDGQIAFNGESYLVEKDINRSKIYFFHQDFFSLGDVTKQKLLENDRSVSPHKYISNHQPVWVDDSHFAYLRIVYEEETSTIKKTIELANVEEMDTNQLVLFANDDILDFDIIQAP